MKELCRNRYTCQFIRKASRFSFGIKMIKSVLKTVLIPESYCNSVMTVCTLVSCDSTCVVKYSKDRLTAYVCTVPENVVCLTWLLGSVPSSVFMPLAHRSLLLQVVQHLVPEQAFLLRILPTQAEESAVFLHDKSLSHKTGLEHKKIPKYVLRP